MAYTPVDLNSELLTSTKLKQMAANDQWLFENMLRVRYYITNGVVRDNGVKMIAGKSTIPGVGGRDYQYYNVSFNNFFTVGCKPIVTATLESQGGTGHRTNLVIQGLTGEIDSAGFRAIMSSDTYTSLSSMWLNWHAVGY